MKDQTVDISEAIVLSSSTIPAKTRRSSGRGSTPKPAVRAILDETTSIRIDWGEKTLIDIGDEAYAGPAPLRGIELRVGREVVPCRTSVEFRFNV